ncbi:hypothetical protein K1T73_07865 [Roseovarius sp. SCSIO 43702]|uniref:hypothetical protein n=1 Tax=Roseovarius sp. SCSIO 43702 TaxID=2823043 RepID=UPI001C73D65A|nr:hypothetical protein [Roseovarius sp. SCSIO 43702]QYX58264.1 hypothetical protein K1T73_07865 [Roseovarius sp. SCSIO 43702]
MTEITIRAVARVGGGVFLQENGAKNRSFAGAGLTVGAWLVWIRTKEGDLE